MTTMLTVGALLLLYLVNARSWYDAGSNRENITQIEAEHICEDRKWNDNHQDNSYLASGHATKDVQKEASCTIANVTDDANKHGYNVYRQDIHRPHQVAYHHLYDVHS